jgi:hypothetical protein
LREIDEYDKIVGFELEALEFFELPPGPSVTYPRTYPTIDITAEDRVYRSLAVNHDSVSGNISMNHSWSTAGSLFKSVRSAFESQVKGDQLG